MTLAAIAFGLPLLWITFCQATSKVFVFLRTLHADSRRRSFASVTSILTQHFFLPPASPRPKQGEAGGRKKMRHPQSAIVILSVGLARLRWRPSARQKLRSALASIRGRTLAGSDHLMLVALQALGRPGPKRTHLNVGPPKRSLRLLRSLRPAPRSRQYRQ